MSRAVSRGTPPTIYSVAAAAGVSPATVSRVLNQPNLVSQATSHKVQAAIGRLGFRPNAVASSLKSKRFRTLAIIVGDIDNPFFGQFTAAAQVAAEQRGFSLLLGSVAHEGRRLTDLLAQMPQRGIDGVVISVGDEIETPEMLEQTRVLHERGVHMVVTGQRLSSLTAPSVRTDESAAMEQVVLGLMAQGRAPIAYMGRAPGSAIGEARFTAFSDAMNRHGFSFDDELVGVCGFSMAEAHVATARLLTTRRVSALMAADDQIAVGAMRAMWDIGLEIPGDTCVVGIGDMGFGGYLRPSLTTIRTDIAANAHRAVDTLIDLVEGKNVEPDIVLESTLLVRESCTFPSVD